MTREAIALALFGLTNGMSWKLQDGTTSQTFITRERRLRLFTDVPHGQQPYVAQIEHSEKVHQVVRQPYKLTMEAKWVIYYVTPVASSSPTDAPSIVANNILDACQSAMAPAWNDPGYVEGRNTLHGLVHHCFIDGAIFKDPGDIDGQAMLVVPITVLVP